LNYRGTKGAGQAPIIPPLAGCLPFKLYQKLLSSDSWKKLNKKSILILSNKIL